MSKRLFFVLGVFVGFLCAGILHRKQKERLKILEAKETRRKAVNAKFEREWQKELAHMPFDERIDYELWEAGMKLDHWISDDEEDDDEETSKP